MARQPDDLALDAGLIRKGEARGLHPTIAQHPPGTPPPQRSAEPPATVSTTATPPLETMSRQTPRAVVPREPNVEPPYEEADEPPLRAAPPEIEPLRFTSFRLPVELDEQLRAMMFETRRSKQDILIGFVRDGITAWRKGRRRVGKGA